MPVAVEFAKGREMRDNGELLRKERSTNALSAAVAFHKHVIENIGAGYRPANRNIGIIG